MMLLSRNMAWPDFAKHSKRGIPAMLAVGAHEQHGPHLSLETDTIMAQELASRISKEVTAILLPPLAYGECHSTSAYPGTLSLQPETLTALVTDIAKSLKAHGVCGLIIVNGHFGNKKPLEVAMKQMEELHFPILLLDYPGLEEIAAKILESDPVRPGFYHADELETSVVLAVFPEVVQMEKAEACYPRFPEDYDENPRLLSDFNPSGVFGDPTLATVTKGERLLTALTNTAVPLVRQFLERIG